MVVKKAHTLLDELWRSRESDCRLQRKVASLLAPKAIRQSWEHAGTKARYAWIYHQEDDAIALVIQAQTGSCLLQGGSGLRRAISLRTGIARVWTPRGQDTLMADDRVWIDFDETYVITPLGNEVSFEYVAWPITSGQPLWAGIAPPAHIYPVPEIRMCHATE